MSTAVLPDARALPGDTWPNDWKLNGFNHAITQAQKALRYLADKDRPSGGEQFPNSASCHMIADELEKTRQRYAAFATPPASDAAVPAGYISKADALAVVARCTPGPAGGPFSHTNSMRCIADDIYRGIDALAAAPKVASDTVAGLREDDE